MKLLNILGHVFAVGIAMLLTMVGRDVNIFTALYSCFIGQLLGLAIEAAQFDYHYQNVKYNDRYRAMIFENFKSKLAVESWFFYAWRTYDIQKTKQDIFFTNLAGGSFCGAILIWIFLI